MVHWSLLMLVLSAGVSFVGWSAVGTKFGLGGVMGGGLLGYVRSSLNRRHGGAAWTEGVSSQEFAVSNGDPS